MTTEKPKQMDATKASDWKKSSEDIHTLTLPSQKVMKLRRPTMAKLLRKGLIPTHCYKVTMGQTDFKDPKNVDPETFKAVLDLMAVYVCEAAVEPKVVLKDPVPEDAIHIDLLEDNDLMFIFSELGGDRLAGGDKSGKLDSFSKKPEGAPDRPAGAPIQPPAVKAA